MLPLLLAGAGMTMLGAATQKGPTNVNWQNVGAADMNKHWNSNRYKGMEDESTRLRNKAAQFGLGGRAETELLGRQDAQFQKFSGLSRMKGSGLLGEAMNSMQRQYASQGITGTASNALMGAGRNDAMKKIGEQNYSADSEFLLNQGAQTQQGLNSIYGIGANYDAQSSDAMKNFYGLTQNEMFQGAGEENKVNIANSQGKLQADSYNAGVNDKYRNRWSDMAGDLGGGFMNVGGGMLARAMGSGEAFDPWSFGGKK